MLFSEIMKRFSMIFLLILGDCGSEECHVLLSGEIGNSPYDFDKRMMF